MCESIKLVAHGQIYPENKWKKSFSMETVEEKRRKK